MLILSRRPAENIVIGHNIFITILSSSDKLVRLGIIAPPEVPVHREEVYKKIQAKKAGNELRANTNARGY